MWCAGKGMAFTARAIYMPHYQGKSEIYSFEINRQTNPVVNFEVHLFFAPTEIRVITTCQKSRWFCGFTGRGGRAEYPGKNQPLRPGDRKTSHVRTPRFEPGPHRWEARSLTTEPGEQIYLFQRTSQNDGTKSSALLRQFYDRQWYRFLVSVGAFNLTNRIVLSWLVYLMYLLRLTKTCSWNILFVAVFVLIACHLKVI